MVRNRTRAAISLFMGAAVLALSIISGCIACSAMTTVSMAPGAEHACCKKQQELAHDSCHQSPKPTPTRECASGNVDLGTVEHAWTQTATGPLGVLVLSYTATEPVLWGTDVRAFASGPPGTVSPPDLLSLHSAFRI